MHCLARFQFAPSVTFSAGPTAVARNATRPAPSPTLTTTVDSRQAWAYLNFAAETPAVTVADPANSTAWHLGVKATAVKLNAGTAGPGGVVAYCVCQNAGASNDAMMEC
ncbi:MAG: HmuY family protein [Gemmatimonadota bacterium]